MSDHYVTVALPQLPDGRSVIPEQMLAEHPDLRDILSRGHNYWVYSPLTMMWLSPREATDGNDNTTLAELEGEK